MPASMTKEREQPLLPQQSAEELGTFEWNSLLDGVLSFLMRDVGYSLLDDVKPAWGGSVQLSAKLPPWHANKSARLPSRPPTLDDESAKAIRREAEAIRIGPEAAKYAQSPDDLVLVWRFARALAKVTPAAAEKVKHDLFYKTVLQGMRLMHLCKFHYSDVVVTLAYASAYFQVTFKEIGSAMSEIEVAHVCVLLIFLAHSFVLDETCPLRCWQRFVFKKYCALKVLDQALFRLFNLQGFRLQLTVEEERRAIAALVFAASANGCNSRRQKLQQLDARDLGMAEETPEAALGALASEAEP